VTDRCNLRCVYCMPVEGVQWQTHESIMRYEEIASIIKIAADEGITDVRLTGGEPLVRKNLSELVRMISEIPKIRDISLTTNGVLLADQAGELAAAGLNRINVSLDTLNPEKYNRITRGGDINRVLRGLEKAQQVGLKPIKINVVILKGVNDDEIESLAELTINHPWYVRFIELMPIKNQIPWGDGFPKPEKMYISNKEVKEKLVPLGLTEASQASGSGPAQDYQINQAMGTIGFINPVSQSFCERCNRLRLTADGNLRPCLLSDVEIPILSALRNGEDIRPLILEAVKIKPENHALAQHLSPTLRCMMQIGG
jgi:cyclic pyranopterin phosphate synthase